MIIIASQINVKMEWYKTWFDSDYYHLLYDERDDSEAVRFVDELFNYLNPAPGARMLDLACGRGRYSRYIADKGFDVTGIDLSIANIEFARQFESPNLSFFTHDMRRLFRTNYFDYIFNFFTSFGYFERYEDHLKVLQQVSYGLKPGGIFLLDYFNPYVVARQFKKEETIRKGGILFHIFKRIQGHFIEKNIHFEADGTMHEFNEKVYLFSTKAFHALFEKAGLEIVNQFGDYDLHRFRELESPRLILLAKRI